MAFSRPFHSFLLVCLQIDVFRQPGCFLGGFAQGQPGSRYVLHRCGWPLLFFFVAFRMLTVISWCALDGYCNFGIVAVVSCCFLLHSRWFLVLPSALCMVIVISWCVLDGRCCFAVRFGWTLSFLGVFWMVTVVSCCTLDGHYYFLVPSGWSLLFPGPFTSNTCHTQANTRQRSETAPNKPKHCARAHLPNCYQCPPQKSGGHSLPSPSRTEGASCSCPRQKKFSASPPLPSSCSTSLRNRFRRSGPSPPSPSACC